jgi:putative polyketide hydroxylase
MNVLIADGGSARPAVVFLQRHGIIAAVADREPGILARPRAAGMPPRTAELLRGAGRSRVRRRG